MVGSQIVFCFSIFRIFYFNTQPLLFNILRYNGHFFQKPTLNSPSVMRHCASGVGQWVSLKPDRKTASRQRRELAN